MDIVDITIFYGKMHHAIDITSICYEKLKVNNIIYIQSNDPKRAILFSDPLVGVIKDIIIIIKKNTICQIYNYDALTHIQINVLDGTIKTITNFDIHYTLQNLHSTLKLNYGSFSDELPEQIITTTFLTGKEKVLEIGGNIGRNSLIIASLLASHNNNNLKDIFVCMETDYDISKQLYENRDLNNFNFNIENAALSNQKLIQKGWDTIISDELLDGYKPVNIISFNDLNNKYNILFDTLVLDCEGSFYYILQDFPDILTNINLIIMENDYHNFSHKEYVNSVLKDNNFHLIYSETGGWGPCGENFFEVWRK